MNVYYVDCQKRDDFGKCRAIVVVEVLFHEWIAMFCVCGSHETWRRHGSCFVHVVSALNGHVTVTQLQVGVPSSVCDAS